MRTVIARPNAANEIEGMRAIGYNLRTALADIVDNSITAQAKIIDIFADSAEKHFKIGVLDDGYGMSGAELTEAMKVGSRNPLESRSNEDLGRFGLGLKTASFSQCRKLTVISKKQGTTSAAIWNLDYVRKVNEWELQLPEPNQIDSLPWANAIEDTGTLVIWENLDRVVETNGEDQDKAEFIKQIDDARSHLELVFHRYLSGDSGFPRIHMSLNGRPLEPLDPFNSSKAVRGPEEIIKINEDYVKVRTFTLPHHKKVSSQEWDKYEGRTGYLGSQGFYVYRQGRLIIHSTWFGLARQKELTKLARVRVDITNKMDAAWQLDLKKASARPPRRVREHLRKIIETIGLTSRRSYTTRGTKLTSNQTLPLWIRIQNKNEINYQVADNHPAINKFNSKLPANLSGEFKRIVELIGSSLPVEGLYADFGNEPNSVNVHQTSDETLKLAIQSVYEHLVLDGTVKIEALENMLSITEPYRSQWGRTQELLKQFKEKKQSNE